MRKNNCGMVRQELDELMLGEACSASATEHLRECAECSEFHQQQTKLRQIVGSLGTVAAPPDFDFRLRARLANDSSGVVSAYWPLARRGFALATVLLVFATGAFLVRNVLNRPETRNETADTQPPVVAPEPPKQIQTTDQNKQSNSEQQPFVATGSDKRPQTIKNERSSSTVALRPKRPIVAQDFSGTVAPVMRLQDSVNDFEVGPLDTSMQSFKVLLDDGRGNARTISVPTVSFGSQRMLQTGNQFAPKRVW